MQILILSLVATLAADARPATTQPAKPVNILFILADQYRADCIGVAGNRVIQTPHLDRLASQGTLFNRMYAAQPVCSPNRAVILTGLYPHSAGVPENNIPLPRTSKALSERLAPLGYDCGYFGKYHLERRDTFETFPVYPGDGRGDKHYFGQGSSRRYATDVITDDAIAFLKRPRSGPFYIYVSYYPPHPPFSVPKEYEDLYKDIPDRQKRSYYGMCTKVDEGVGRLMKALEETGLADRTLVMFSTDHGHNFVRRWNDHDKRLCCDTAARIPLIVRLPGVIPAGRKTDGLISSVDLVPTMLSLLGQQIPPELQGQDLSAFVRGKTDRARDCVFIENVPYALKPFSDDPEKFGRKGNERCVFDGEWKLILSTHRPPELLDLKADPQEKENRWPELKQSSQAKRLLAKLAEWGQRTKDGLAPRLIASASQ